MNIGLLTYHSIPNFGANLQALATVSYLKLKGHNVTVLNYRPLDLEEAYLRKTDPAQIAMHHAFAQDFLPQSRVCRTETDLVKTVKELQCDSIIVGSDAVFHIRSSCATSDITYPNPFWLKWVNGKLLSKSIKTAALSASCMGSLLFRYDNSIRRNMAKDLRKFNYISVRDRWTKWMIMWIAKRKIRLTVDPTAILSDVFKVPDKYKIPSQLERQKYIIVTLSKDNVDTKWISQFADECHKKDHILCALSHPEGGTIASVDFNVPQPIHPLQWYNIMINSSGYIGERFHPVAISLFHKKPILAVDGYSSCRNYVIGFISRLRSKTFEICKSAGLSNHCISRDVFWTRCSPEAALNSLLTYNKIKLRHFSECCRKEFYINIDACLDTLK